MDDRSGARAAGVNASARLETFADGVMAIAITLLILEIDVPSVPEGRSLLAELAHQWPSYAAYIVSFITIGIIWVNHHHMFSVIQRTTHTFLVLNVVFLMTIAFLPWPTALVAEYVRSGAERATGAMVYGGTMTMIAIMFAAVWRYAARGLHLLPSDVDRDELARINRSYLSGPIIYATAALIALVNPWISLGIYAAMAVFWLIPGTGPRLERLRPGS